MQANVIHLDNHVETHEKNISVTNFSEAECTICVHESKSEEFILHMTNNHKEAAVMFFE
jgi:hypothetical protein